MTADEIPINKPEVLERNMTADAMSIYKPGMLEDLSSHNIKRIRFLVPNLNCDSPIKALAIHAYKSDNEPYYEEIGLMFDRDVNWQANGKFKDTNLYFLGNHYPGFFSSKAATEFMSPFIADINAMFNYTVCRTKGSFRDGKPDGIKRILGILYKKKLISNDVLQAGSKFADHMSDDMGVTQKWEDLHKPSAGHVESTDSQKQLPLISR